MLEHLDLGHLGLAAEFHQAVKLGENRLRGRRHLCDDPLDLGAGHQIDLAALLLGVGQELGILGHGIEGRAQGLDPIGGNPGADGERPPHRLGGHQQAEIAGDVLDLEPGRDVFLGDVLEDQGHAQLGQFRMLLERQLEDGNHVAIGIIASGDGLEGRPGLADAIDLAALDRQMGRRRRRVALDQLELGVEGIVEQRGKDLGVVGAGAAHQHRLGEDVIEGLDAGALVDRADAGLVGEAAEPMEFSGLELHAFLPPHDLDQGEVALQRDQDRAILGRDVVDEIGDDDGSRPDLVLDNELGIAGNEAADMAGDHAGIGVIAAAGRGAHIHDDPLALVEIGDGVRHRRGRREAEDQGPGQCRRAKHFHGFHVSVLPVESAYLVNALWLYGTLSVW